MTVACVLLKHDLCGQISRAPRRQHATRAQHSVSGRGKKLECDGLAYEGSGLVTTGLGGDGNQTRVENYASRHDLSASGPTQRAAFLRVTYHAYVVSRRRVFRNTKVTTITIIIIMHRKLVRSSVSLEMSALPERIQSEKRRTYGIRDDAVSQKSPSGIDGFLMCFVVRFDRPWRGDASEPVERHTIVHQTHV